MKKALFIVIIAGMLLLAGCFSPYSGDEGTVTISFGGDGRVAVNGQQNTFTHEITLTGSRGNTIKEKFPPGAMTATMKAPPGSYTVTVRAMGDNPLPGTLTAFEDRMLRAYGEVDINLKAGTTEVARITMKAATEVSTGAQLSQAVEAIYTTGSTSEEYILVAQNFIAPYALMMLSGNIIIIPSGATTRTITTYGTGSIFTVGGGTLTIRNIKLEGPNTNTSLVTMSNPGGNFIMETGSSITGNTNTNTNLGTNNIAGGGGVIVGYGTFTMNGGTISANKGLNGGVSVGPNGTFIMNGGTISGNTNTSTSDSPNTSFGGGVYVNGGTFTMNSGSISGNTDGWGYGGGGVHITDGTFTMVGGTISGNTTGGQGGGVHITGGTFNMTGGTISNNSSEAFGGGVLIGGGTFNMTGGSISGNKVTGSTPGGGVCVAGGTLRMTNGIIYGNTETNTALRNTANNGAALHFQVAGGVTSIATYGPDGTGTNFFPSVSTNGDENDTIHVVNGVLQ